VGYMSPEQVRGAPADIRSDIFSFGAVLYEMLTGVRAFRGDSAVETLNAILKEDPQEFSATNRNLTPALERVVWHCLEKNPERRFQSANDVAFALESVSGFSGSGAADSRTISMAPIRSGSSERLIWIGVTGLLALAVLALAMLYLRRDSTDLRVSRLSVVPPDKATLMAGEVPTVSPDGTRLVFVLTDATGKTLLYLRVLDSLTAQPLVGTEGGGWPFWSPNGREIGFFAGGKLKKIDLAGGQPITLADAPVPRGGSWNVEGVIIFTPLPPGPTLRISASGGAATPLNTIDIEHGEYPRWSPQFLPDGRHYLFHSSGSRRPGTRAICVGSLDSPETKTILISDFTGVYAPPGYLLFRRETTLMAQKFDAARFELSGDPFAIAEQIGFDGLTYKTLVSVSAQGVLAYETPGAGKTQLAWFDREGKPLGVAGEPGDYSDLALSPDNKRVAFYQVDAATGNADIWLMDLASGSTSRFTFDPAVEFMPVWSPDGSQIVFTSFREGGANLYQKASTGAGQEEALYRSPLAKIPTDWSRDGRYLLCETVDPKTRFDLWVLSISGDHKWEAFLQTPFNESRASFAPNGRWIVYESDESGRKEIYVQSFPSTGAKWEVSTSGGSQPHWRSDGKELFYLGADRKMTAVEVSTEAATFSSATPRALFETRISKGEDHPGDQYAVTSDGRRFLVNSVAQEGAHTPITVVLNWTADLKR
ncbi:MAG TPA: protein kinase, partial [Bryobacteraceae bacterium]|nr:protein kinase [Bryobacteraceae bacterium]